MDIFIKKFIKSDDNNNLSVGKLYNIKRVECERVHPYCSPQPKYGGYMGRCMYLGEKNNALYFKKASDEIYYTQHRVIPIDFIDKILNETLSIDDFDVIVPLDRIIDVDIDKLNESLSEREYFIILDWRKSIIPFKAICVDIFNPKMFAGYSRSEKICIINENDLTHPQYIKYGDIKFEDNYITLHESIKPISIEDVKSNRVEIHNTHILIHKQ